MWIKICANTNLEDAQLAAELGADAVGFVFAPSPRQVTAADVSHITPHLPEGVECVGVFPALPAQQIATAAQEAGLNTVQLHGGVSLELVRQLDEIFNGQVRLIQTVHWDVNGDGASAAAVAQQLREIASDGVVNRVLIDSKVGAATGGTGVSFDWSAARSALAEAANGLKLIVAGGLNQDNVAEAIRGMAPWGVDVASGVEQSPGRKDPEKLSAFIRAARESS
ncbi:MAG TPA: phosphoribosylanthranilate isomerase [Edaphobacter sp.]|jgi:phosphoribosylanthranilate isomerase|nr:phosphoribosylanthranilate isomerase [Edaphobacter sp.]